MLEVEGACELMSSGGVCGGVWKKVKSKEKSGRCIRVGGENWEKNKKGKIYILLCRYIILMSRIGK